MMRLEWAMCLPEAWRLLRISFKPWRMAAVAFVSVSICVLIVALVTVIFINIGRQQVGGGCFVIPKKELFGPEYFKYIAASLFGYQMILWVIGCPAVVCAALSQEFTVGTWVFQETSPQPAWKLLLGKLVGAPGDFCTASMAGLPFFTICLILSDLSKMDVLQTCIFIMVMSLFFSALLLFSICIVGEQTNSSLIASFLIPSLIIGTMISSGIINQGHWRPDSFTTLHPLMLFLAYYFNDFGSDVIASPTILFFGTFFPLLPFMIVFYAFWAVWFLTSAIAHVRFKMSLPMKRYHLFVLFAAVEFIFLGFVYNYAPQQSGDTTSLLVDMMGLSAANLFMLYAVIFLHSRSLTEIRPWLYAFGSRRVGAADFFRDDAPVIFTIVPLLIIYLTGAFFLAWMYGAVPNVKFILAVQAAAVVVIVLRDALFFQGAGLMAKKGKRIALFVYGLAFLAVPGLFLLANHNVPVLDLSPITAVFAAGAANSIAKTRELIVGYMILNGLLAVAFAVANVSLLSRARARLNN